MSIAQATFKATLARYYKAERDRTEECLGDIIKILEISSDPETDKIDQILIRLVKHYER